MKNRKIQVITFMIMPTHPSERIFNPMRCTGNNSRPEGDISAETLCPLSYPLCPYVHYHNPMRARNRHLGNNNRLQDDSPRDNSPADNSPKNLNFFFEKY